METNYLKAYARHFNLCCDGVACWNKNGEKLLESFGNKIYYKSANSKWSWAKHGDLVTCIINGIPLQ